MGGNQIERTKRYPNVQIFSYLSVVSTCIFLVVDTDGMGVGLVFMLLLNVRPREASPHTLKERPLLKKHSLPAVMQLKNQHYLNKNAGWNSR